MADEIKAADQKDAPAAEAPKGAEGEPADSEERIQELSNRLAERGRAEKALREEMTSVRERAERAEAKTAEYDAWFNGPEGPASAEAKLKYQAAKATDAQTAPKLAQATARGDLLEAITMEENPVVKKALKTMYDGGKVTGRFPDRATIDLVKTTLTPSDTDEEVETPEPKKVPPKVGAVRSTRSVELSIDQQIAEQEKAIKEGRASFGTVLGLMAEKQKQDKAASGR